MSIQLENYTVPKATLQNILDFLPYPFLISQPQNGIRINIYVNEKFLQEIGYSCQEIPSIDDWFRVAYPEVEYRNQIQASWELQAKIAKDFVLMRARIFTKYNGYRWYEIKSSLHQDIHMVAFVNIDKVILHEQELERMNENKDKMLSILGHDLRVPLMNLQAVSKMALDSNISPDEFTRLLLQINQKSFQVMEFLDTTLQWTKANFDKIGLQSKTIDMTEIWSTIFPVYKNSFENKKITIAVHHGELDSFQSDPEIITIVLRNLISNALKFTPEGGSVSVTSQIEQGSFLISVTDSGQGISPDVIERILTDSYSPQKGTHAEKGLGIGLRLCRDLLKKINGDLQIKSDPGKGTSVQLVIPTL